MPIISITKNDNIGLIDEEICNTYTQNRHLRAIDDTASFQFSRYAFFYVGLFVFLSQFVINRFAGWTAKFSDYTAGRRSNFCAALQAFRGRHVMDIIRCVDRSTVFVSTFLRAESLFTRWLMGSECVPTVFTDTFSYHSEGGTFCSFCNPRLYTSRTPYLRIYTFNSNTNVLTVFLREYFMFAAKLRAFIDHCCTIFLGTFVFWTRHLMNSFEV